MSKEAAVVVAKPDAVMLERICNPDALKAQLEQLLEQLAPLDMTTNNTLSAKEFEIGLPPPRSLPAEVLPKTQEAEPAERLGTLVAQLEEAVKEAGEETMEGGLLRGMTDYAEYMQQKLKSAGRTQSTGEVDAFVDRELRSRVLATIRGFCTELRATSTPSISLDALQRRLADIRELEAATDRQTDVQSKKASLHNAWDGMLQGIAFIKAAVEQHASLAPAPSHPLRALPCSSSPASSSPPSSELTSSSSSSSSAIFEDLTAATTRSKEEQMRLLRVQEEAHQLQTELLSDQSTAAAALDRSCSLSQRLEDEAREARDEYHAELAGIVAFLAPRLPSLHARLSRAAATRAAADAVCARVERAAEEWEREGGAEIKAQLHRLEGTKTSIHTCTQVLATMKEGCDKVASELASLAAHRAEERREVEQRWVAALCDLQDRGRMSLAQTLVKNDALLEELHEEKQRVAEEVEGALERLDLQEEETLKARLQGVNGRISAVAGEIKSIAHKIDYVDTAFRPVLAALQEGRYGVPLSAQERAQRGIEASSWAFWVGQTVVRDRSGDVEAFALQHRQHRLEQLRKQHKREFEVIQRMKESLHTHSLRNSPAQAPRADNSGHVREREEEASASGRVLALGALGALASSSPSPACASPFFSRTHQQRSPPLSFRDSPLKRQRLEHRV